VFAIVFWGATNGSSLRVRNVDAFLLGISVLSTGVFSWFAIFLPAKMFSEISTIPRIILAVLSFFNLVFGIILTLSYVFEMWDYRLNLPFVDDSKGVHVVVFILFLILIDLVVALSHKSPDIRARFRWLCWAIDLPTLAAMLMILYIYYQWLHGWGDFLLPFLPQLHDEGAAASLNHRAGALRGETFEAGAIAFQLMSANIQILVYDIVSRLQKNAYPPLGRAH